MQAKLNLVIAHKLEARSLIDLLQLHAVSQEPAIYSNEAGLGLIISGEGVEASTAAVHALASTDLASPGAAWLNIGIAGHQSMAIGESLLVDKLVNRADGQVLYPVPLTGRWITGELHTVTEPEFAFPDNVAYDMEAFGFFSAAVQYTTLELVQSFKIISDNAQQDASTVTAQRVHDVMVSKGDQIELLAQELLTLQQRYQEIVADPDGFDEIISSIHLTATQQSQLRRLLQRAVALEVELDSEALMGSAAGDGRQLISKLRARLGQVAC